MKTKELNCAWCGKVFFILVKEYHRQIRKGREVFFCGLSCAASFRNETVGAKILPVNKECPVCHRVFQSDTSSKAATFCSRSCASKGSVTEYRRQKAREMGLQNQGILTIDMTAASLRTREAWKYAALEEYLTNIGEPFQFEYPIDDAIFDLALTRRKMLVEFDSDYHESSSQQERDLEKDETARTNGWTLERVRVARNMPIHPSVIRDVLTP
jgi:very-short-patch-repair endonuclease